MAKPKYSTTPVQTTGLPPGIPFIIGNEAAERFCYYGLSAILVVFMTDYLRGSNGALSVMTGVSDPASQTETAFALQLDGAPILFFDLTLSVGPNNMASSAFSQTLTTTMSLDFNTFYSVLGYADSDSGGSSVPEPPTAVLLFTALLGIAPWVKKLRPV